MSSNTNNLKIPFVSARVAAGFPSPAEDFVEKGIDLNEQLIRHPTATFFVRVVGDSMRGAMIADGDVLIVDRAVDAKSGDIVIATVNGEFTVKRIRWKGKRAFLIPENDTFAPIEIVEGMDAEVWGVVTYIIHKCSR